MELDQLREFADLRGRPCVFFCPEQQIEWKEVLFLRNELSDRKFEELDLVIHSGGGDIHAAYQIVELLRLHTNRLNACVPLYAKSAVTLLCIGADVILLDELAQLGPLDTQLYEVVEGGRPTYTSALNVFKTLEQLQKFALNSLDEAMRMISLRSSLSPDECLRHAMSFVEATTQPLLARLDPQKLGECSRALSIGTEYGLRLLGRFTSWDQEKTKGVVARLVQGYPSHDYIIDYKELGDMGFEVRLFEKREWEALQGFMHVVQSGQPVMEFVLPKEGKAARKPEAAKAAAETTGHPALVGVRDPRSRRGRATAHLTGR